MTSRASRNIRRVAIRSRLDQDTWPGLNKVKFEFEAIGFGEAIAGPFMFGRAFDAPPMFTHSVVARTDTEGSGPIITIGVTDWIRDQQDMYVGANLWIVIKAGVCREPIYAGKVLEGRVFDDMIPSGPEGNEFPSRGVFTTDGLRWPSTHTQAFNAPGVIEPLIWMQTQHTEGENDYHLRWVLSTENPYQGGGVHHARVLREGGQAGNDGILPGIFMFCDTDIWGTEPQIYWRVEPGTTIKASVRAMSSEAGTDEQLNVLLEYYNEFGAWVGMDFGFPPSWPGYLTTSYKLYEFEGLVPTDAKYVRGPEWMAFRSPSAQPPPPIVVDVADPKLEFIKDSVTSSVIGRYDIVIKFEGQSLQGYGNIHEIEPNSGPTRVVL